MRLERERGQTQLRRKIEEVHRAKSGGQAKQYFEIAAEIYDEHPTADGVRVVLLDRYGVKVCRDTASAWINKGLAERRKTLAVSVK